MAEISLEALTGKLDRIGYETFIQALRRAKGAGNRNLELAQILQEERSDLALTVDHFKLDREKLASDIARAIDGFRHYATLFLGETQIRTGHILAGASMSPKLFRAFLALSPELAKIPAAASPAKHRRLWAGSEEEGLGPLGRPGLQFPGPIGNARAEAESTRAGAPVHPTAPTCGNEQAN